MRWQCFPQKEMATGCQVGPDESLSSVLLYTHVLYKGKYVGGIEYCYSAVLHYWLKSFQHHNDYSALFIICC
jgi:hypothetical protein